MAGDARRGGGEPDREGLGVGAAVAGPDLDEAEAHLVGGEGVAEAAGLREEEEAELREELPHAAPATGDEAGPDGVGGGEGPEDLDEDVVGERAEPVLARGREIAAGVHGDGGGDFFFCPSQSGLRAGLTVSLCRPRPHGKNLTLKRD